MNLGLRNLGTGLYYYNQLRGRHIRVFMFYTTNRCNARCLHCNIWKQKPKINLSPQIVESVLEAKCTNSRYYTTVFGLEGGEFLLHPEYRKILELVKDREFLLLSNAVLDDVLIDTVREFEVKQLHMSLDGDRKTHAHMRGIDIFDRVDHVVDELKNETKITLVFTISPYNSYKDFIFVKNYCKKKQVELTYSIFANFNLFDVDEAFGHKVNVMENYDLSKERNPYLLCYQEWIENLEPIPCCSPLSRVVCYPDGSVPFCCHKNIILGNLNEQSLDEIWHSRNTRKIQKEFVGSCNDCWISFHRRVDFFYINHLEKGFPKYMLKRLLGNYTCKSEHLQSLKSEVIINN